MKVFISGGCKNGKTSFAQDVALKIADGRRHFYVATMLPKDAEDNDRIARHIKNREGMGFETEECPVDIINVIAEHGPDPVYLVDSVTALLQNEMFPTGVADDKTPLAVAKVVDQLTSFAQLANDAVFVSDYIYSDAMCFDDATVDFQKALAEVDVHLAFYCDVVVELVGGNVVYHKGQGLI